MNRDSDSIIFDTNKFFLRLGSHLAHPIQLQHMLVLSHFRASESTIGIMEESLIVVCAFNGILERAGVPEGLWRLGYSTGRHCMRCGRGCAVTDRSKNDFGGIFSLALDFWWLVWCVRVFVLLLR